MVIVEVVVEVVVELVVVVMTPVDVVILSFFSPRLIIVVLIRILNRLKRTFQKLVCLKKVFKIQILSLKFVVVDSSVIFFSSFPSSNCSSVAPDPSSPNPFFSSRTSSTVSTSAINVF